MCDKCNGYGHNGVDCVKKNKPAGQAKKIWVVKQKSAKLQPASITRVQAVNTQKVVATMDVTPVKNRFDVLTVASTTELFYDVEPQGEVEKPKSEEVQGCETPDMNG